MILASKAPCLPYVAMRALVAVSPQALGQFIPDS